MLCNKTLGLRYQDKTTKNYISAGGDTFMKGQTYSFNSFIEMGKSETVCHDVPHYIWIWPKMLWYR